MKLKSLLAAVLFVPSTMVLASPILIHQYDFNGSGVTDLVGTENGTLVGGATVSGGKLVLDGSNDWVDFSAALVPLSGDFSVQFDAQGFPQNNGLYTEMISQGGGFYIGYDPAHNFRFSDTYLSTGLGFPNDNLTHNYLLTSSASGTSFYIDYTLVFSGGAQLHPTNTDTRLGRQYGPHAEYFPGNIDNVSIYQGAFSIDEVHAPVSGVPDSGSTVAFLTMAGAGMVAFRRRQRA
ncbi:MAG TPA: LamG-like jellyroll fold domain-containing protein [Lacunisphaera sp.]|nr:LamG-like jellyroll fold domain-containing protein [Lacunisphaera sp.]